MIKPLNVSQDESFVVGHNAALCLTSVVASNTAGAESADDETEIHRLPAPLRWFVGSMRTDIVAFSYDVSLPMLE